MRDMKEKLYIWGCYHTITHHTIYVCRGTPPLYISSPEQINQDRYQETLEAAGDKGKRIKKLTNVNESKQCMEGGIQEESVEYIIIQRAFN